MRPSRTSFALLCSVAALVLPMKARAGDNVSVLYAGSLVNLMEHAIGPAYEKATGDHFEGVAGGSNGLANQIKGKLRRGDVFISASPAVNATLTGAANGDWESWNVQFAQSPLVIGYSKTSPFAGALASENWIDALNKPGIRVGRTDPAVDPKGAFTVTLLTKAEEATHRAGLAKQMEGAAVILPEETLVGRLQSGQLDAGYFYSTEANDAGLATISPPAAITPSAHYTVTILNNAPNAAAAQRFVSFLLGPQGASIMKAHGLEVTKPTMNGNAAAAPDAIRRLAQP